jgi:hypothetical protein
MTTADEHAAMHAKWDTLLQAYLVDADQRPLQTAAADFLEQVDNFLSIVSAWPDGSDRKQGFSSLSRFKGFHAELSHTQCAGWSQVDTWGLNKSNKTEACDLACQAMKLGNDSDLPSLVSFSKSLGAVVDGRIAAT